jgi:hypothetical protein
MKCPIENCKKDIQGLTGFDELCKLQAHMNRVHRKNKGQEKKFDVFSAMVLRDHSENEVPLKEEFE